MKKRLLAASVLVLMMWIAKAAPLGGLSHFPHQATVSLGFVLIIGFLFGHFVAPLGLPRITGYILAGIVCGPFVSGLLTGEIVEGLQLIDDIALALIAFSAGGELRIRSLRPCLRSIVSVSASQTVIVFTGTVAVILAVSNLVPFLNGQPLATKLAIGIVFGLIATANSPATAVALINEARAQGPFTDTVLGVTVLKDVVVLVLITMLLPVVRALAVPDLGLEIGFVRDLGLEIGGSLGAGVLVGVLITQYMRGVGAVLPLFVVGVSILISQMAQQLHLEPLLLCVTAGFVVENLTPYGDRFIRAIGRSALPIYVVFFTIGGASLDLLAVRETWLITVVLVSFRVLFLWIATGTGERLAGGGNPAVKRLAWMGFLAQAGVTLGLASIVARKFPGWGDEVRTIALAMIAVNQLVGPVAFRIALIRSGEAGRASTGRAPTVPQPRFDTPPPSG